MEEKLNIKQMLLIGSTCRNNGKTTLAVELIKSWKSSFTVIGLKVTTIEERDGKCPRGGEGCGVCASVKGNFEIVEELNTDANKDTSILLASGAEKVYWLKTLSSHIYEGMKELMQIIPSNALIVCESNSLRNVVKPGVFIMLDNRGDLPAKKSARKVAAMADITIKHDVKSNLDNIIKGIKITEQSGLGISLIENMK